jgi:tetratricopeptide (TPR) repeat protein
MLGAFEEGVAEGAEMLASDVPEARTHGRLWALASLGTLHVTRGDVARAVSLLEPALVLCRRIEMWALFPRVAAWLGSAYTLAGRLDEATAILDEAVARARSLSFTYVLPEIQRRQGEAYRATGRLAAAEEILSGALALARTRGELGSQTDLLRTLGDLARDRDAPDLEAAAARYRDALVLADRLGMRPTAARCLFGLGHVLRRQGRPAQAELGRAVEQFRDLGMALWLPQAEEELARAG